MTAELAYPVAVGAPPDLYSGRTVLAAPGYNVDPSQRQGPLRTFRGTRTQRPGAFTPRTTRSRYDFGSDQSTGTSLVSNALARVRAGFADHGPSGSRAPWYGSRPRHAGLNPRDRTTLRDTPALNVIRSAVARTGGMMRLGSYVTGPADAAPIGLRTHDPYPIAPPPVDYVSSPTPVQALPGTPGIPHGEYGVRFPWSMTQNQGQVQVMQSHPVVPSPLPGGGSYPGEDQYSINLPLMAPGTQHVASEDGEASYTNRPGYPDYKSPWGYQGGERIGQPPSATNNHKQLAVAGAVAAGAIIILMVRKKRRK